MVRFVERHDAVEMANARVVTPAPTQTPVQSNRNVESQESYRATQRPVFDSSLFAPKQFFAQPQPVIPFSQPQPVTSFSQPQPVTSFSQPAPLSQQSSSSLPPRFQNTFHLSPPPAEDSFSNTPADYYIKNNNIQAFARKSYELCAILSFRPSNVRLSHCAHL